MSADPQEGRTLLLKGPAIAAEIERYLLTGESDQAQRPGGGALQAAIAAWSHASPHRRRDSLGPFILYDGLLQINPSPLVALNRAVAV